MGLFFLFGFLILLGYPGLYPVLGAPPDLVVRLSPSASSPSDSSTVNGGGDDAAIEFLAKRAQFGSRDRLLEGRLVRPPGYDFFLCERFRRTVDVNENGQVSVVALPPFIKPQEGDSTVMLVPRGECTFERKAFAAKHFYGAKAILIYDRLGARYTWNETSQSVNFPQAKWDYECANGNSMLYDLPLNPPAYNETQLDPVMGYKTAMPTNPAISLTAGEGSGAGSSIGLNTVCNLTNTALNPCESQLCLVTSHLENSTNYPVCCAWDTPITMPEADDAKDLNTDDILAVWLTIRQAELIFKSDLLSSESEVSIKSRGGSSSFNISYIFMWIWGTLVMMAGALYSAGDYRRFNAKLTAHKANRGNNRENNRINANTRPLRRKTGERKDQAIVDNNESGGKNKKEKFMNEELHRDLERGNQSLQVEMNGTSKFVGQNSQQRSREKQKKKSKRRGDGVREQNNEGWSLHSLPPPERKRKEKRPLRQKNKPRGSNNNIMDQPNTEEEIGTLPSTLVPARESKTLSAFEFSQWHAIALVVIASLTLILLYFFPRLYTIIFILWALGCAGATSYLIISPVINTAIPKLGDDWAEEFNKPVICGCNGFNITCNLITYIWAFVWIWYGITHYRPQINAFFWITLNIFGACVCILSVTVLKLSSIKIATLLMVAIFIYDVFFVFITPFLTGGISVMLQVASGRDDPLAAELCLRYPDDCKGIGFLPMLFIFPKVNDYARGTVILGLGDIFWPGFLVAFCARHDEAARLLGTHTPFPDIECPSKWHEGYLFPMMIAYALGLFCAFLAVILTGQGQPALLYIVPICLTTIFILGRKNIRDLWNGSKVLKLADGLIAKTERNWGKTRMKQFAERVRRQNAENEIASEMRSAERSRENPQENFEQNAREPEAPEHVQPKSRDICFGYEDHPGTKYFRKVVEEVANEHGEEEFKPEIYKLIRKKLKGRRFFKSSSIVWAEASKLETRKQVGRAYDRVRGARSRVLRDSDPLTRTPIT